MSPLAFDKQGKPFSWHPRTAKLRVRLFRNPAARGTCCQVLDASGRPLFVESGVEYAEFRRTTGSVPGLYRLDQCDEDGVELESAPAAYLTIEPIRNGGGLTTETSPNDVNALAIIERLVAVQERMFASQADVMRQMASQHGVLMNAGSVAMQVSAEIMRAPYRAPLALPEPRNAATDETDDTDERDEGDNSSADSAPEANSPLSLAMSFITPEMAHQLGAGAVEKILEAFRTIFGAKQRATASAATVEAAPTVAQHVARPDLAATSPRTAAAPSVVDMCEPRSVDANGVESNERDAPGYDDGGDLEETAPLAAGPVSAQAVPNPRLANAGPPATASSTPDQLAHLMAIYQRLSPRERAIAQRAVAQMNEATRSQWISALSARSVDDAIADLRGVLAHQHGSRAGSHLTRTP